MTTSEPTADADAIDRGDVVDREKDAFGGVKLGCAFFGWLTATGMTVLLAALVAAVGAGVGIVSSASEVADVAGASVEEITWAGVALVLGIVLVSYYTGGYVAGRMARFDGIRQGIAVFGWAVVAAIVVAVLGAVAGAKYNVLDEINSFPRIPDSLSGLPLPAIIALGGVIVVALVGSALGGLAGMHFHRKVDLVGLGR